MATMATNVTFMELINFFEEMIQNDVFDDKWSEQYLTPDF